MSGGVFRANFPKVIRRCHVRRFLSRLKGQIVGLVFVKRTTGKVRRMSAIYRPDADRRRSDLLLFWDLKRRAYRYVPIRNLVVVRAKGKEYRLG